MEERIILVRESSGVVEYYMNDKLFFIHYKSLDNEYKRRDMRRELSERVMFCIMANLGYEIEFRMI